MKSKSTIQHPGRKIILKLPSLQFNLFTIIDLNVTLSNVSENYSFQLY